MCDLLYEELLRLARDYAGSDYIELPLNSLSCLFVKAGHRDPFSFVPFWELEIAVI